MLSCIRGPRFVLLYSLRSATGFLKATTRLTARSHGHIVSRSFHAASLQLYKSAVSASSNGPPKYCAICGRIISPNHAHFVERKTCSRSCSATRLTDVDTQLEALFMQLAKANGKRGATTEEVGKAWAGDAQRKHVLANTEIWRERIRRAGRRVVVLARSEFENGMKDTFECVQKGRPVEPSFAKGEWAVRLKTYNQMD